MIISGFDKRKAARIILASLIFLTLGFIFFQSALPPSKSVAESDAVSDFVGDIIPEDTRAGEFIQDNIRKLAHLFEYMALGLWVSLYVYIFMRKRRIIAASYALALFVALIDETVQIFSLRGASVLDVWLDFFGFSISAVLVYTVHLVTQSLKKRVEK